jgi:hypothetical protein
MQRVTSFNLSALREELEKKLEAYDRAGQPTKTDRYLLIVDRAIGRAVLDNSS